MYSTANIPVSDSLRQMNVIHKIDLTVEKYNMLSPGDSVCVGVSGGKDSMLLLYYLLQKREELNLKLTVANVEHGIRGESSVRDSEFVKEFCEKNNIEFNLLRINAPEEAERAKMGVEEYSRKRRYKFFSFCNTDKIATAHSLSDNVETLIFRLLRGTSLKGMCGIKPVRGNIIRPLIECETNEIIKACEELNIPYVTDETNADNRYSRNKIRNEVVPLLESINPKAQSAVARFAKSAASDEEYLELEAKRYLKDRLDKSQLLELHPSILNRVLEMYAKRFNITLDEKHLREIRSLVMKDGRYQIKGNLFALSKNNELYFDYLKEKDTSKTDKTFNFETKIIDNSKEIVNEYKKEFTFYCDCDKIFGDIFARNRKEGDRITLPKRNCTKSLKKLFNELKIPVEDRENIPVICDGKGVIGVYGLCVDDRVKTDNNTSSILLLKILTED